MPCLSVRGRTGNGDGSSNVISRCRLIGAHLIAPVADCRNWARCSTGPSCWISLPPLRPWVIARLVSSELDAGAAPRPGRMGHDVRSGGPSRDGADRRVPGGTGFAMTRGLSASCGTRRTGGSGHCWRRWPASPPRRRAAMRFVGLPHKLGPSPKRWVAPVGMPNPGLRSPRPLRPRLHATSAAVALGHRVSPDTLAA